MKTSSREVNDESSAAPALHPERPWRVGLPALHGSLRVAGLGDESPTYTPTEDTALKIIQKVLPWLVAALLIFGLGYFWGLRVGEAQRFVPVGGGNVAYALDAKTGMRCSTSQDLPQLYPAPRLPIPRCTDLK